MTPTSPLQQEIDARLAAAGIVVPADLKAGIASEIRELLRMVALLRGPRAASVEPFSVLRPASEP